VRHRRMGLGPAVMPDNSDYQRQEHLAERLYLRLHVATAVNLAASMTALDEIVGPLWVDSSLWSMYEIGHNQS